MRAPLLSALLLTIAACGESRAPVEATASGAVRIVYPRYSTPFEVR